MNFVLGHIEFRSSGRSFDFIVEFFILTLVTQFVCTDFASLYILTSSKILSNGKREILPLYLLSTISRADRAIMSYHRPGPSTTSTSSRADIPKPESIELATRPNPFSSPIASARLSAIGSTRVSYQAPQPRYFHSRRIKKGEAQRPWLDKKDPREKWVTIIPIIGFVVGLLLSGLLIYDGLQTVQKHVYCPVYLEEFSSGMLDPKVWTKEVEVGGYGYRLTLTFMTAWRTY